MRTFLVVFLLVFSLGACSSGAASPPSTASDPRLVEGEPLFGYGVTNTEIRIGSSFYFGDEGEKVALQDGFKAYLDFVNSNGGIAGKNYEFIELDTTGDALTHLQNIRMLGTEEDSGVAMIALLEDHALSLIAEPELVRSQMLGLTLATEEQWSDPQSNIQKVTAKCGSGKEFTEAFENSDTDDKEKDQFLQGWTQAKFVDAVFLAAAKKGDISRPALAAMAAAYDQSTLCL